MYSLPPDNMDKVLRYVGLRWSIDYNIGYKLEKRSFISGLDSLSAGECFGAEPFFLIKETVPVVKQNIAVQPFGECMG